MILSEFFQYSTDQGDIIIVSEDTKENAEYKGK